MIQLLFIWDLTSYWGQALPRQVKASKDCHCCSAPDSLLGWRLNVKPRTCSVRRIHGAFQKCASLQSSRQENMHNLSQTKHRKMMCSPVKFRNYKNRTLMVYCKQELIAATCQWRKKWQIESNHATMISPHPGRAQPHPAFSRASGLQYHNSPCLTVLSCLCIFIFPSLRLSFSPSFWFYAFLFHSSSLTWTVSLSEPLALSRQTSHPSAPTDRKSGKKEKEKWEKGRIVCQCHPFLLLLGKCKFHWLWVETLMFFFSFLC